MLYEIEYDDNEAQGFYESSIVEAASLEAAFMMSHKIAQLNGWAVGIEIRVNEFTPQAAMLRLDNDEDIVVQVKGSRSWSVLEDSVREGHRQFTFGEATEAIASRQWAEREAF